MATVCPVGGAGGAVADVPGGDGPFGAAGVLGGDGAYGAAATAGGDGACGAAALAVATAPAAPLGSASTPVCNLNLVSRCFGFFHFL